jgi:hypothetical protein
VDWAANAYCDGSKWMEVRLIQHLTKGFDPGSVICLNPLGNCIVDLVFQIGGLKDLQALCVHKDNPDGTELLGFGLSRDPAMVRGESGSPVTENFLFSSVGMSFEDLNNKGVVVFTVKWPKRD